MGIFLLVVNDDHAPILHGYRDTGLQRFWGHELDLLGSRDVTSAKEVMFLPVFVCLSVCLSVCVLAR